VGQHATLQNMVIANNIIVIANRKYAFNATV